MKFTYTAVSDRTKLELLQRDALGIEWPDLSHKNWCLHCEQEFDGRSVRVFRMSGGGFYLECGTPGCDGSPIDWAPYPWWDPEHPVTKAYLAAHPEQIRNEGRSDAGTEDDPDCATNGDEDGIHPTMEPANRLAKLGPPSSPRPSPTVAGGEPLLPPRFQESDLHPHPRFTLSHDPVGTVEVSGWEASLEELRRRVSSVPDYDSSWDCFLQHFVADPRFLANSSSIPHPTLRAALQTVVHRAFPNDATECQILIMQLSESDLIHGAIHSCRSTYMFLYLSSVDYGLLRSASWTAGRTMAARFRIAQGRPAQ